MAVTAIDRARGCQLVELPRPIIEKGWEGAAQPLLKDPYNRPILWRASAPHALPDPTFSRIVTDENRAPTTYIASMLEVIPFVIMGMKSEVN